MDALLPAWNAASTHDLLTEPTLGLGAAGHALGQLARTNGPIDAAQSVVARYGRHGFQAAALTALDVMESWSGRRPPGPHRTATLRFTHPYAVVATTRASTSRDPWNALPVFGAWITDPDDTQDSP
ncbi:hypothetical protein V3G39_10915 [Dermatophilaceae bacterium Sec6.4]